jgi:predicted small lipoprotein YifL
MKQLAAVLACCCLLSACGQKGSLYLPVKPGTTTATAVPAAAGSAQPAATAPPADAGAAPSTSTTPAKKPGEKDTDTPAPH